MKSSKVLYLLIAVVILAGAFLVGRSLYNIYFRQPLVTEEGRVRAELNRVREKDLQTINSEGADERELIKALYRYGEQNLPGAEEIIKKHLADHRPLVQAAAIELSGAYEWADLAAFKMALASKDPAIQKAALKGLAKRSSDERKFLVLDFLRNSKLEKDVWMNAQMVLLRYEESSEGKGRIRDRLLQNLDTWDSKLQDEALRSLYRALPRDPVMGDIAKNFLGAAKSPAAVQALQYVQRNDPEWLKTQIANLPMQDDYTYQLAVIDYLAQHCPEGWSQVSEALLARPADPGIPALLEKAELKLKCRLGL